MSHRCCCHCVYYIRQFTMCLCVKGVGIDLASFTTSPTFLLLQVWFSRRSACFHGQTKPSFPGTESVQSQLESRWHTVGLLFVVFPFSKWLLVHLLQYIHRSLCLSLDRWASLPVQWASSEGLDRHRVRVVCFQSVHLLPWPVSEHWDNH